MRLSELQTKELINTLNGKRVGNIIDVIVTEDGRIKSLVLEEKRGKKFTREETVIYWNQITKIGDDIILVDTNKH